MTTPTSSKTFTCCPPPLGTPDPSFPPDIKEVKPRPRVILPAQEKSTCIFAAADRIRFIIGNHSSVSQSPRGKAEAFAQETLQAYVDLARNEVPIDITSQLTLKGDVNKKKAQHLIDINKNNPNIEHPEVFVLLNKFVSQTQFNDLRAYVIHEYNTKELDVCRRFFKSLFKSEQLDQLIQPMMKGGFSFERCVTKVTSVVKKLILTEFYHLTPSNWHPSQPLSSLIEEVDAHGPLQIFGKFGQEFYEEKPFRQPLQITTTVRGVAQKRCVWGWKPGAKRKNKFSEADHHSVVLVGALKNKKLEVIFFIDPLDPSDPKNLESQKIYMISLKNLRQNIYNLSGAQLRDKRTGENVFFEPSEKGQPNDYALYGDTRYL